TITIPPASARAISSERFIEIEKNNGDPFFKYKIIIGILPLKQAKNNIFVIVPIISLPMSFADFLSAFIEILLSFSYSSKIEADIVIATSITAPNEPTKTPAINTNLYGRVKKSIASYLNPSSLVTFNNKYLISTDIDISIKLAIIAV